MKPHQCGTLQGKAELSILVATARTFLRSGFFLTIMKKNITKSLIFFYRVTESSKDNCMDSKNLAICWWPTLLQYEFGDLGKFEAMRPHLEDIVQTMVDQYRFLFCGQEEVMMV